MKIGFAGALLVLCLPLQVSAEELVPWTMEHATYRVDENYTIDVPHQNYLIMAARNEFAAIQIVYDVSKLPPGSASLCVRTGALHENGGSAVIEADNVRVYRAAPVPLYNRQDVVDIRDGNTNKAAPDVVKWMFDPLIPYGNWDFLAIEQSSPNDIVVRPPSNVPKAAMIDALGGKALMWVDVFIPQDAKGGDYSGTLYVQPTCAGEAEEFPIDLKLLVTDAFTLPPTASLKSGIKFNSNAVCVQHGHSCNTPDMSLVSKLYARFSLDHRLTLWLDHDRKDNDHPYNGVVDPLVNGQELSSLKAGRELPEARLTSLAFPWQATATDIGDWWNLLSSPARAIALFELPDEPHADFSKFPLVEQQARLVKSVSPDLRTLLTTSYKYLADPGQNDPSESEDKLLSDELVDILVPNVVHIDNGDPGDAYFGDQMPDYVDDYLPPDSSREAWSYQSCASHGCADVIDVPRVWPDITIDTAALQNRAEPWLAFLYGHLDGCVDRPDPTDPTDPNKKISCVSGLHYYEVSDYRDWPTSSSSSPFAGVNVFHAASAPGARDGNGGYGHGLLVYPGTPQHLGGNYFFPVPSIRLQLLREGMEDYEWLKFCYVTKPQDVMTNIQAVFPNASGRSDGFMYSFTNGRTELQMRDALRDARFNIYNCITGGTMPGGAVVNAGDVT